MTSKVEKDVMLNIESLEMAIILVLYLCHIYYKYWEQYYQYR